MAPTKTLQPLLLHTKCTFPYYKNFRQYKKLLRDKFVKVKTTIRKIFRSVRNFLEPQSLDDLVDFLELSTLLSILLYLKSIGYSDMKKEKLLLDTI